MAMPADVLVKISFLMFKLLLGQSFRRRRLLYRQKRWCQEHLFRLHRMRRLYSRLSQERMLYIKLLTAWVQANSSRKRRNQHYHSSWWEKNVKERFTRGQWLKYFRVSKETFMLLVDKLKPTLFETNKDMSVVVPIDKQIAITLLLLSSGKSYNSVSYQFSISKSKISVIVKNVCEAIVTVLMPQYVTVPKSDILRKYLHDFETKWGFPQCAGVLGSIHVPISSSELPENATDYINSDGGHSMFLQGVVDSSYKFWDLNIGWPGSVSESRVLTSSSLWLKGQDGTLFPDLTKFMGGAEVPIFILAGSSYPLAEWVLKPFQCSDPVPDDKQKFNERFGFAYNVSEIAFKRLKARWNCLAIGNICSIDIFPNVAAACCTLHNLCECQKEPILDEWIVKAENFFQQPLPSPCNSVVGTQAEFIRQAVKDYFLIGI